MRVQCDVCEMAVASVMCCADEAALCADCDTRVHAANKVANKHQRVSLIRAAGDSPRCDICQEKSAFFFCLEDRALLCRDCDVSIHSATALSSAHQRFLVPGTKVALEALSNNSQDVPDKTPAEDAARHPLASVTNTTSMLGRPAASSPSISSNLSFTNVFPNSRSSQPQVQSYHPPAAAVKPSPPVVKQAGGNLSVVPGGDNSNGTHPLSSSLGNRTTSITEFLSEAIPNWHVDELLNIPDLADGYTLGDVVSSKADVTNLGDYDWTSDLSLFDEQVYAEKIHEVPQMISSHAAPTVVGGRLGRGPSVMRGRGKQGPIVPDYDDAFVVPDLGLHSGPESPPIAKRRRPFVNM